MGFFWNNSNFQMDSVNAEAFVNDAFDFGPFSFLRDTLEYTNDSLLFLFAGVNSTPPGITADAGGRRLWMTYYFSISNWGGFATDGNSRPWFVGWLIPKYGRYTKAAHEVNIDLTAPTKGHREIMLDLPGGKQIKLERRGFKDRSRGDSLWQGHSPEHPKSNAVLTVKNGLLVGRVTFDNEAYSIRPGKGGKHIIERLDPDAFPACDSSAEEVIIGKDEFSKEYIAHLKLSHAIK